VKRKDEFVSRREAGRVFQTRGPAMLNDRSPIAVRDLGTSIVGPRWQSACLSDADQCTVGRWTGTLEHGRLDICLWTMVATLNVICKLMTQCIACLYCTMD